MEPIVGVRVAKLIAVAITLPFLCGCAGLHLGQERDQVIQRTEGEDNYLQRQKAGPVAARVLPYALLAEQSYDPRVYLTHRIAPRASACDDPIDCDTHADDEHAARWLDEWRYVWSCNGPDQCGVRTAGQSEPVGGLGVQIWARKGAQCPEVVIAFRGTVGGDKGDWESNFHWILRAFPIYDQYDQVRDHIRDFVDHIERDKCYRPGSTEITAVGHSLGGGLAQLAAYSDQRIRRVLRLRSLNGDGILFGESPAPGSQRAGIDNGARLRIWRSPRLRPADHAALYPLVALQSPGRKRPVPGLSGRSDRAAQPDRS